MKIYQKWHLHADLILYSLIGVLRVIGWNISIEWNPVNAIIVQNSNGSILFSKNKWNSSWPASLSLMGLTCCPNWLERWFANLSAVSTKVQIPVGYVQGRCIGGSSSALIVHSEPTDCHVSGLVRMAGCMTGVFSAIEEGGSGNLAGLLAPR